VSVHDLAIITVAIGDPRWIRAALPTVFAHLGELDADVVVVDVGADGANADVVAQEFPRARAVRSANHGFGYGNNSGLITCDARYVLFLNPDTEILEGSFEDLVRLMDSNPTIGLAGCRQITGEGRLDTTIRYFPNALRAIGEALAADRLPGRRPRWLGERELDPGAYDRQTACDWTSGSYMLVRREALDSAGWFDERFFLFCEEIDLCRRIRTAGWEIVHLPQMTILHHDGRAGVQPHLESLAAHARRLYAGKHLSTVQRPVYLAAVMLRHALRAISCATAVSDRRSGVGVPPPVTTRA
jgi:GT2 family glycosyltransferase